MVKIKRAERGDTGAALHIYTYKHLSDLTRPLKY